MAGSPSIISADRAAVQRSGFPAFVEIAGPHLPDTRWIHGRYQRAVAEQFEALMRGECEMLAVNMPPGGGKSDILSVMGAGWIWANDPTKKILTASCSLSLSQRISKRLVSFLESDWYRDRWGEMLVPGCGAGMQVTLAGGYRMSSTVLGGSHIGSHGDLFLIDDPIDPKSLSSAAGKVLENTADWLTSKVLTRQRIGTVMKVCLVMQRLHVDDTTGVMLREHGDKPYFRHLCLPGEFEPERSSPWDWRKPGELLFPEDPTRARGYAKLGAKTSEAYRSQVQQDPLSGDARIFVDEYFREFTPGAPSPEQCILALSIDPTFTGKKTADDVAFEIWGFYGGNYYCFYSEHEKLGYHDTLARVYALHQRWRPNHVLVEKSANGPALIEALTIGPRPIHGVEPVEVAGGGSKASRAKAAAQVFSAGCVYFDKAASWYDEKARFLLRFTGAEGGRDDTVDTTSQAILWLQRTYGSLGGFDEAMTEAGRELRAAGLGLDLGLR